MYELKDSKPAKVLAFCIENKFRSDLKVSEDAEKFKLSFGQLGFSEDTDGNLINVGIIRGFCLEVEYSGSELYRTEENYKWHEDFIKAVLSDYANHYKAKRANYPKKCFIIEDLGELPEYCLGIKNPDKKVFNLVFGVDLDDFFLSEKSTFEEFLLSKQLN